MQVTKDNTKVTKDVSKRSTMLKKIYMLKDRTLVKFLYHESFYMVIYLIINHFFIM